MNKLELTEQAIAEFKEFFRKFVNDYEWNSDQIIYCSSVR